MHVWLESSFIFEKSRRRVNSVSKFGETDMQSGTLIRFTDLGFWFAWLIVGCDCARHPYSGLVYLQDTKVYFARAVAHKSTHNTNPTITTGEPAIFDEPDLVGEPNLSNWNRLSQPSQQKQQTLLTIKKSESLMYALAVLPLSHPYFKFRNHNKSKDIQQQQ